MRIELNFPNPVSSASDFFGLKQEQQAIQEALVSPVQRPIAIIGERRIGKTSLLNVVAEWLQLEQVAKVLHLTHAYSRDALLAEILSFVCIEVRVDVKETGLINELGQFSLVAVSQFISVIRKLVDSKPQLRFVICLDEFDSLLEKCDKAAADQIIELVLHLIEKTDLPLRFVFTMTQITERILRSYRSPFLSSARLVPLEPWSFDESCKFVDWLVRDDFLFDDAAHRQIFVAAGGHPFFTKAILETLSAQHDDAPAGFHMNHDFVESAIASTIHSPEFNFALSNIAQAHFTPEEIRLIERIILKPNQADSRSTRSLGAHHLETANKLVERGYLDLDELGNYFCRSEILGRWFAHRRFGGQALAKISNEDSHDPLIFISHSTEDDDTVTRIHDTLTGAGINTWVDHIDGIRPGDAFDREIQEALNACKFAVFVLSPASAQSVECDSEWRHIFSLGKRLYVVVVRPVPTHDFPWRLRGIKVVDLATDVENGLTELIHDIKSRSDTQA